MTRVTLVFEKNNEKVHVECYRLPDVGVATVELGDYIACPYSGFVHVRELRVEGTRTVLTDHHGFEHHYLAAATVEVVRPLAKVKA